MPIFPGAIAILENFYNVPIKPENHYSLNKMLNPEHYQNI